jgi:hypothetical protein
MDLQLEEAAHIYSLIAQLRPAGSWPWPTWFTHDGDLVAMQRSGRS